MKTLHQSWPPQIFILALSLLPLFSCSLAAEASPLADKLLVVYNSSLPVSKTLADHYAKVRHIPPERVLGIPCSTQETITRSVYINSIRDPIDSYIQSRDWMKRESRKIRISGQELTIRQAVRNEIWVIVLIHGIPLRIEEEPSLAPEIQVSEPLRYNRASVDSELCTLPVEGLPSIGLVPNPYFSDTQLHAFRQNDANQMIMVCRLDGPDPETVRRMIDDAVETEKLELTGRAYLDSRGIKDFNSGYRLGDQWIEAAGMICQASGLETEIDSLEATVPDSAVWDQAALYFGWYAGGMNGPFLQPGFHFRKGAIAYHIHSFSAETIRSREKNWAGPLLAKGAAATMGSVYEPYLRYTPDISVFLRSLISGYTFAESAYQSQLALSWTMTMLGDPLYRPYPRHFLDNLKMAEASNDPAKDWLLLRAARMISTNQDPVDVKLGKINSMGLYAGNSGVFDEGHADILRQLKADPARVIASYQKAIRSTQGAPNIIRNTLKLADFYASQNQNETAIQLYENLLAQMPSEAKSYGVPRIAYNYAAKVGWQKLSPGMQQQMSPVNQPQPKPEPKALEPSPATTPNPQSEPLKPAVSGGGFSPSVK